MKNVDYEMIIRYFNGKCEDDERQMIVQWANESDEHSRKLFEWEEMYFLGKRADGLERERVERAEKHLFERIGHDRKERKVFVFPRWTGYAAAVVLILLFSGLAVWYFDDTYQGKWQTVATADGEVIEVVLPDSSHVWLNENSALEYPERFTDECRRLNLSGEAYFEVTKDRHRPFIVSGESMDIQVLGTKFNFKNAPGCRIVEASLLEGEIRAEGKHEEGAITLLPGQKVELNKGTGQMKVLETDAMLDAVWHSDMVRLVNADIVKIAGLLEEIYDVKIILSPDMENISTYSGELKKKSTVTGMLELLRHTLHIKYKEHNNVIFISSE